MNPPEDFTHATRVAHEVPRPLDPLQLATESQVLLLELLVSQPGLATQLHVVRDHARDDAKNGPGILNAQRRAVGYVGRQRPDDCRPGDNRHTDEACCVVFLLAASVDASAKFRFLGDPAYDGRLAGGEHSPRDPLAPMIGDALAHHRCRITRRFKDQLRPTGRQ
ncbi:hypothetical protein QJ522_20335 [Sedimentisphaerales bacterium M17dextr]|uniref:Uncharacterized protein n=1 Tax=Anaerobaca lacustris TaxID=3044600 RepID=A0AAW6U4D1_9BACT|nr:hypothetical protein [Sedimentisphaerales bacterium M17dextr]